MAAVAVMSIVALRLLDLPTIARLGGSKPHPKSRPNATPVLIRC